jgi:hypothetical protein
MKITFKDRSSIKVEKIDGKTMISIQAILIENGINKIITNSCFLNEEQIKLIKEAL